MTTSERGEQPVSVQAVERRATTQRADDVTNRLRDEQHTDPAEVRSGTLAQLAEGGTEQADRQPDDRERR